MKQNPHDKINEFLERLDVTRRELIAFRESLAEEGVAALNANNATQGAVYAAMFDRVQVFLECIEKCCQGTAFQVKGPVEAEQVLHEAGAVNGSEPVSHGQ